MRFLSVGALLYLGASLVSAASIPAVRDLAIREELVSFEPLDARSYNELEKRKGGGGKHGSGSSSSSSGSKSGSGGSSTGSSYSFSSTSNTGGRTRSGSGVRPAYGGGRYYAGGASVPYNAGARSPRGISPFLFPAAALGFFPGLWLYGAYAYPYSHHYYYRNTTTNANQSVPVECLCQEYNECSCDDNGNSTYVSDLMNTTDGSPPKNSSIVKVVDFGNGTEKVFINGTLDNGTTASGGTDPSNSSEVPSSVGNTIAQYSGYWVMIATVIAAVMLQ